MRPNWFIGLPVPAEDWFARRVGDAPEGVRRFHPDDLHLTVAFLGGVDEDRAGAAWGEAGAWREGPLRVSLGEVVPMGPPRRFSALSAVLVEGRRRVEEAIGACRKRLCAAADVDPDRRPPKAHLTVARVPRRASRARRDAALRWAEDLSLDGVHLTLDRLALYTWSRDRHGRRYRIVAERALRPGSARPADPGGANPPGGRAGA